jgi:hypothetical protein
MYVKRIAFKNLYTIDVKRIAFKNFSRFSQKKELIVDYPYIIIDDTSIQFKTYYNKVIKQ